MQKLKAAHWRRIAIGLAVLGIVVPLAAAVAFDDATPRVAMAASGLGLACLLVAFVVFDWSRREGLNSRLAAWEPAVQQMRGATLRLEQMHKRLADIDTNSQDIRALKHLINEERHNLSQVASGMVDIRAIIDAEQANLGAIANAVYEIRVDTGQLTDQADEVFGEVREFSEMVQALRSHLDALSARFAALDERSIAERRNLGLVAAGLDDIRRAAQGVERFEARQAAFEDVLVSLSDRIDALGTPGKMEDASA